MWDQEAGGSNQLAPTIFFNDLSRAFWFLSHSAVDKIAADKFQRDSR